MALQDRAKDVTVRVEGDPLELPIEIACGMIGSELVTNTFKHAFHGQGVSL